MQSISMDCKLQISPSIARISQQSISQTDKLWNWTLFSVMSSLSISQSISTTAVIVNRQTDAHWFNVHFLVFSSSRFSALPLVACLTETINQLISIDFQLIHFTRYATVFWTCLSDVVNIRCLIHACRLIGASRSAHQLFVYSAEWKSECILTLLPCFVVLCCSQSSNQSNSYTVKLSGKHRTISMVWLFWQR
jgi:hypothetical protein